MSILDKIFGNSSEHHFEDSKEVNGVKIEMRFDTKFGGYYLYFPQELEGETQISFEVVPLESSDESLAKEIFEKAIKVAEGEEAGNHTGVAVKSMHIIKPM